MENLDSCSIEQQLCKLKLSSKSRLDFYTFMGFFKKKLTDLLSDPLNDQHKVIEQENLLLSSSKSLEAADLRDFFELLGFQKQEGQYMYLNSDENMMKLETCLELIGNNAASDVTTLEEINDAEVQGEPVADSPKKKSKSDSSLAGQSPEIKSFSSKAKEFFFLKHMKKEGSERLLSWKSDPNNSNNSNNNNNSHDSKLNSCKSAEYIFSEKGFFQQSCRSKDQRKDSQERCGVKGLFHIRDRIAKKWEM